jgi:hypothetical protein
MDDPQHGPKFTFQIPDAGHGTQVDEINCIVRDVSMITGNLEAKGHDLHVDDTTLKQIFECAKTSGQVPVKLNHGSGIEAVNGFLTNFRRDGDKVKADWHLLKTHDRTKQLLEIAIRQPKTVGLSVTFRGSPETKGGKKHARCTELVSTDLVPHPAANPDGMFEEGGRVDRPRTGSMPESATPAPGAENTDPLSQILDKLTGIEERLGDIEDFCRDVDEHLTGVNGAPGGEVEPEPEQEEMSRGSGEIITQLEEYFQGKIHQLEQAEEAQKVMYAFEVLREKQGILITALEEKDAEITALHDLVKEYRSASPMAPVRAGGGDTTMFAAGPAVSENLTEFESLVRKEVTELSTKNATMPDASIRATAVRNVMKANPQAYDAHRKAIGAAQV